MRGVKQASGARVLVAAADAPIVEGGGKGDYLFGPEYYYPPTKVDATVSDGEVVRVGGIALTAHLTPGHTRGRHDLDAWTCTDSTGRGRHVVFLGSTTVNPGTKLVNNDKYPAIAADYQHAFEVQKALPCEVFLAAHASAFNGPAKAAAAAGGKGDAAFIDPKGCRAAIDRSEKAFLAELAKQRAGREMTRSAAVTGVRLAFDGRRAVRGTPISSSARSLSRQSGLTFTRRSRNTFVSKNASRSCRASVPIRLIISPPRPMTIGFCDSVSTKIVQ